MPETTTSSPTRPAWWHRRVGHYTRPELIADGIVHGVGIAVAAGAGSVLLAFAIYGTASSELPALILYVGTLLALLLVSMSYNLVPPSRLKGVLARFDQAAIFLFIAGTYTPFLALLGGTTLAVVMGVTVWGAALVGVALKLIVPARFGRTAILLYLAIGWSGVVAFQALAAELPTTALWLLVAGGGVYSLGIVFHLWERLQFHNVMWHAFVVVGSMLHLGAMLDAMVLSRLA